MRDYRSHSQIDKYDNCPRSYRYKYIDGLETKANANLVLGSAMGKCMEHVLNEHKFTRDSLVPPDPLLEEGLQVMSKYMTDELPSVSPTQDEIDEALEIELHLSFLVKHYFKFIFPKQGLIPLDPEVKIDLGIKDLTERVTGYIDMLCQSARTGEYVVVDFKTINSKPSKPKLGYRRQTWLYANALQQEMGLDHLPTCQLHHFVKRLPYINRKRKTLTINGYQFSPAELPERMNDFPPELIEALYDNKLFEERIVLLNAPFSQSEWLDYQEVFFNLEFSIRNNFWPKNRNSGLCTPQYCDFWDICMGAEENSNSLQQQKLLVDSSSRETVGLKDVPFQVDAPESTPDWPEKVNNFLF